MFPCWLALTVYLTSHWNNKDQSVSGCKKISALSFIGCTPQLYYYLSLLSPPCTQIHTCSGYISWRHAVWKPLKHWGPAPTVPSCLYKLVTQSATNARRSQSEARQHLCTSEHISVSLRVLELSREVALRTLATVRQSVGVLQGLT